MKDLLQFKGCLKNKSFNEKNSKGRTGINKGQLFYDDDDIFKTMVSQYRVDLNKIANSKAFRRLAGKTQVFTCPDNLHIRTRQQHSIEVWALTKPVAVFLGLNVDLAEAVALGHDIGHPPFGHFGEKFISDNSGVNFHHSQNGVLIANKIERKGQGLNLCHETLLGIEKHSRTKDKNLKTAKNIPEEINLVMYLDKISYLFADFNDAKRLGHIKRNKSLNIDVFGAYQRHRVAACIAALTKETAEKGYVSFTSCTEAQELMHFRQWMYKYVYQPINFDTQKVYFKRLINFFQSNKFFNGCDPYLLLSLMTDQEVFHFGRLSDKAIKLKNADLKNYGLMEIVPFIKNNNITLAQNLL